MNNHYTDLIHCMCQTTNIPCYRNRQQGHYPVKDLALNRYAQNVRFRLKTVLMK